MLVQCIILSESNELLSAAEYSWRGFGFKNSSV